MIVGARRPPSPPPMPVLFGISLLLLASVSGGQSLSDDPSSPSHGHIKEPDLRDPHDPGYSVPCATTFNSVFGEPTSEPVEVSYVYEIETNKYVPPEDMATNMLPDLEVALNDEIIPSIFEGCKNERRRVMTTATKRVLSMETVAGISTSPSDNVLVDVPCDILATENHCTKVEGRLTLYLTGGESGEIEETQNLVKTTMRFGRLNSVNETIVSIVYASSGPYMPRPTPPEWNPTPITGASNNLGIIAISVSAALTVGAALLILGLRLRAADEDEEGLENKDNVMESSIDNNATFDDTIVVIEQSMSGAQQDSFDQEHARSFESAQEHA